ncbi:MAG: exodeoxyribonuclease VII small subunit [Candidatus Eremiobacteraeota bacterium]|nr:exodeoxyribonuclease VII small subunit [Candidatus Eremiobacteraeota bacterium]MBV9056264.1 exodeoxyribonuclease VII small subunit [Candidatus Eremiobacteraeota bacterium]MBV9698571.1 exodeoxyribonuclease VII small subunit [Candidatus Eremiobacteraeota bacterium]
MTTRLPQTFEEKLARIDAIVKELEGGTVELQRATELFKEGKVLARQCEALLRTAQEHIDEAAAEPKAGAAAAADSELRDELPF